MRRRSKVENFLHEVHWLVYLRFAIFDIKNVLDALLVITLTPFGAVLQFSEHHEVNAYAIIIGMGRLEL